MCASVVRAFKSHLPPGTAIHVNKHDLELAELALGVLAELAKVDRVHKREVGEQVEYARLMDGGLGGAVAAALVCGLSVEAAVGGPLQAVESAMDVIAGFGESDTPSIRRLGTAVADGGGATVNELVARALAMMTKQREQSHAERCGVYAVMVLSRCVVAWAQGDAVELMCLCLPRLQACCEAV